MAGSSGDAIASVFPQRFSKGQANALGSPGSPRDPLGAEIHLELGLLEFLGPQDLPSPKRILWGGLLGAPRRRWELPGPYIRCLPSVPRCS